MSSIVRLRILWFSLFALIAGLSLAISMYFETRTATTAARRYLQLWETEIARATLMAEKSDAIDKIYRQIEEFHPALRLLKPNEELITCPWPITQQISLYSLPASQVTVCREPQALLAGAARSPIFFSLLFVVMVLILFALRRDHRNELRRLAAEAKAESEARLTLISKQVAHDIRGPLSALQIFAQNVPALSAEHKSFLGEISSRIHGIAEDLLQRTKLSVQEEIDVDKTIDELIREWSLRFKNKSIQAHTQTHARLSVDRVAFGRALSNLVQNAADTASSEIKIHTRRSGRHVEITVSDRGPGLALEPLQAIRERRQKTNKAQGFGLGVSFVQNFMDQTGGKFEIESAPSEGTRVTLKFPI